MTDILKPIETVSAEALGREAVAAHIAEMAIDQEGIEVSNPGYHPARFAARRAALLALALTDTPFQVDDSNGSITEAIE